MSGRTPTSVQQLDYETGKVIAVYRSISEAAENNGIENDVILRRAINERNGYMVKKRLRFRYTNKPRLKFKCRQLDYETGEEIEVYDSVAEAARDNFITPEGLTFALKHQNGIMPNRELRFEYVDD